MKLPEEAYDEIMSESRKIFQKRWDEFGDPYAFHKAFEHAKKKILEYKNSHIEVRFTVNDKRTNND